jgi:hypothetical protein
MKKPQRENKWGAHPANGGFAPERFPAFTIELLDWRESEGPGNLSSTDYRLVVSDGDASVEIETTNRRGRDLFEFRGQKYSYQVHDGDDGVSYTVFPVTVGPGGVWSQIPQQGTPLPWLPFELDGVRIEEDADLPALVARTLGGWTPAAARPFERETPAGWALKLWSSLTGTGLEDEVARAAGACLRSTDARIRAAALRFFERAGQVPGSEVIEEVAAASDVDPLDAVLDPTYASGVSLGMSVRKGLSSRIEHLRKAGVDPGRALTIAKSLILQPGRADDALLSAVRQFDWPWFKRHKERIVKANPEARTFMRSLKKAMQRGLIQP